MKDPLNGGLRKAKGSYFMGIIMVRIKYRINRPVNIP